MTIKPSIGFLILILIVAFPLFAHLDSSPLAEWDESRLASNSFEMSINHNWIVTYYNGSPDMWNTKPPLLIWIQVLMMNILGVNELAVRLPSALAALATCILLYFFFIKKYKAPFLGLLSAAILVTTDGYIRVHSARMGDYDALLTFFMTGYALTFFLYLEEGKRKNLYYFFALLILAALTKGVAALLFIPALFVFALYKKRMLTLLKAKEFYIGLLAFAIFVAGYYLLREHYNPGYIAAVGQNEWGGRYNTTLESHDGDGFKYIDWITDLQFHNWYLFVVPGIIMGFSSRDKKIKDFTFFITLLVALYLIIISNAQTKLYWYTVPLYPFLAITVALFVDAVASLFSDVKALKEKFSFNPFLIILLFFLFYTPVASTINLVLEKPYGSGSNDEIKNMELFLQSALHNHRNIDGYTIINLGPEQHLGWYYKLLYNQHHAIKKITVENLVPNNYVLAYKADDKKFIEDHYNFQVTAAYYNVKQYKLYGRK